MSQPLLNDLFLRACARQPTPRTPVWLMRQAGRYLPEYRATRAKAGSFMALATNPELACEVTLQPIDRYGLDAAIIFSDILTIPDAMGLGLHFVDGEGPKFSRPLRDAASIHALTDALDVGAELRYVTDAISLTRRELNRRVPLIGFSGSPWTLACYMIEGSGSADFARAKALAYSEPKLMHTLLGKLARAVSAYLAAQIEAGAEAVMVFDTWGGQLSSAAYHEFSLPYVTQAFDGLAQQVSAHSRQEPNKIKIPRIFFTKGGGQWLESMVDCGADVLGLDWQTDLARARDRVGHQVALQGNLDPTILLAAPTAVAAEVERVVRAFGPQPGHIFNLGHGISQHTPPENVKTLVETVAKISAR